MPLFIAVFAYYYLQERLTLLEVVVLLVSFVGVALMIIGGDAEED